VDPKQLVTTMTKRALEVASSHSTGIDVATTSLAS